MIIIGYTIAVVLQFINIIHNLIERDLKVQTYNTGSMTERLGNMVAGFAQPVQVCQNIKNDSRSVIINEIL